MKKDDLKSLVTQMYEDLLENIDSQKDPNKEQLVTYLQNAVMTVQNINEDDISSVEHAKLAFSNAYKEIANKTLSSYKNTNNRFEKLTKIHEQTVQSYEHQLIDMPSIKEKFNEIQNHMSQEVQRANQVIAQLSAQVKELESSSNLDALTKIFNRRALDTYLKNLCDKKELKHELHVLLLDIDDFKKINDKYGHIAGDKILIFVANMLRKALRDGDKVFRYGGEEFLIVLNRIDVNTCQEIADRILKLVSSNQLFYKGEPINVTISIGSTLFYPEDTPEALINRADKALYKSKKSGKNQINMELKNGF
ncbi:GGDEF domain-containing protein [Sulfurimonas autotrophica]|uniref:diguanylate cyclase n=1 Tax=Sulfurimonas autotrophica (strain ATCC BAA-671 / DSM 16294 / JCM 11897 / OK10) TaxID=563040 RepID=E0UU70_SULAO|nr:GGDEF domain-containing protein [Sulfurimonas autotrophica]ADN09445.1 diguanylate cyclase [Sulfurimonas autotrophica DSM 16294]